MTIAQETPQNSGHCSKRRVLAVIFFAVTFASAQVPGKAPTVSMAAVPLTTAQRAQATMVNLNFRVPPGYHINSNTPKSEFLIPTALKMDLPTDIILGKIEYPAGEETSFPFSPDGVLRYQACDNAACYPPKALPVSFEVKVVKEPAEHHANPAQSPHVHN
jgi:hypothetical protein